MRYRTPAENRQIVEPRGHSLHEPPPSMHTPCPHGLIEHVELDANRCPVVRDGCPICMQEGAL